MEAEVDYNIVDYYYYPDSDLETIQEESEDDRSTIHNSRRSSFSTTSSMRREEIYSNPKLPEGHANSPNQASVDSFFPQKIVYAKCLTSKPPFNQGPDPSLTHISVDDGPNSTVDMFAASRAGDQAALGSFSSDELSNSVDEKGNTPLHLAAEYGHLECVKMFLSFYPPHMVSLPNDDLSTACALAIKNNHFACVKWMLGNSEARSELSVSQQASSIDGSTTRPPLAHVASQFGRNEILEHICEEMAKDGVSLDLGDQNSNTPVHVAARFGHLRCVQTLVARGCSVTLLNSEGDTPGQSAQRHGHDSTVGYLVVVETCVSLAQQLVSIRNEVDTLKLENEKLLQTSLGKVKDVKYSLASGAGDEAERKPGDGKEQPPLHDIISPSISQSNSRKPLQEQPPPPKIWQSPHNKQHENGNINMKEQVSLKTPKKSFELQQNKSVEYSPKTETNSKSFTKLNLRISDIEPPNEKKTTSNPKEVNNEVESITEDMKDPPERKPWEKLTMDEMLRMVRDIRYQPSPSVSLCTEDSTLESVEVMRERMAAASRWFLVENGREKPKQLEKSSNRKNVRNHPPFMTSSNRQNKFDSRMRQAREGPKQPKNAAKIQEAIQQQYRLVPAANEKTDDTKSNLTKFDEKKISPSAKDKSKSDNTVTTGTLKFMVSHSKSSKLRNAEPTQSTKQKRDASDSSSLSNTASTQRNNSYRRAVQVASKDSSASPTNSSKSVRSDRSVDHVPVKKEKNTTVPTIKASITPEKSTKQKNDPLSKRTGKDNNTALNWTPRQYVPSSTRNEEFLKKYPQNQTKFSSTSTPRYNQWTLPSKGVRKLASNYDEAEKEEFKVSEVPELKAEIPTRQSSFLRRVQGKLK